MAAQKHFPGSVPNDTDDDDDTNYDAAAYRVIELSFLSLWEAYRVSVFFSLFMFPPASYVEGLSSQPLFAFRTRVLKSASLK